MFGAVATASTPEARARAYDVVQELVTNIQFANDEGDPGAGLELGTLYTLLLYILYSPLYIVSSFCSSRRWLLVLFCVLYLSTY